MLMGNYRYDIGQIYKRLLTYICLICSESFVSSFLIVLLTNEIAN